MNLNGGYAMIKHDATQEELADAYKTKRPVLLYDVDHRAHWAQINEKVIETVDEETQETITTYEYSYQLLNAIEALVDDSGNPRFIEGTITPETITGLTFTYCKWSLSGTHLMVVLAGTCEDVTLANNVTFSEINLPDFIMNKIVPLTAQGRVSHATLDNYYNYSYRSSCVLSFVKGTNVLRVIGWGIGGSSTLTAGSFRVQFDLIIDAE